MGVTKTSKDVYYNLKASGYQSKQKYVVYHMLKQLQPCSIRQIAEKINEPFDFPVSTVSGRLNDLQEEGLVEKRGTLKQSNGKTVVAWVVKDSEAKDNYQLELWGNHEHN